MQQNLGIAYKDASHRLYMAKLEKLKVKENTHKAFTTIKLCTDHVLKNFSERLLHIARNIDMDGAGSVEELEM